MDLTDTTAVVTGAGSGIGRATASRLAAEGATVVVTDVDAAGARETVDGISDAGDAAEFRRLDVTDREAFGDVLDAVVDEHGSLDVLVNNAGVGQPPTWLQETSMADRDRLFSVNIEGVWNGCHAGVPHMLEQGSGAIVNVSSLAGQIGAPGLATYSMTKGAVLNFTRAVAAEVGPVGVRANAVCPGFVDSNMVDEYFESFDDPEAARANTIEEYPLRRLARYEDVASAIAFLASDDAAFVTGHGLTVDGGFSAQ
jgi:NAD(P)-dependent dehydrogenase (short-subunit alcohol dehydrogenase family)